MMPVRYITVIRCSSSLLASMPKKCGETQTKHGKTFEDAKRLKNNQIKKRKRYLLLHYTMLYDTVRV